MDLFIKRYDSNNDFKIRYIEFVDAFTPKDKIYADHLAGKKANYLAKSPEEAMCTRTKLEFGDALKTMLKCEGYAEDLRASLGSREGFSISGAFQIIDSNSNGFLGKNEFRGFLEDHEFFATQKEIDLLFEKFDRDKDGMVTYAEFFNEMANKFPL